MNSCGVENRQWRVVFIEQHTHLCATEYNAVCTIKSELRRGFDKRICAVLLHNAFAQFFEDDGVDEMENIRRALAKEKKKA